MSCSDFSFEIIAVSSGTDRRVLAIFSAARNAVAFGQFHGYLSSKSVSRISRKLRATELLALVAVNVGSTIGMETWLERVDSLQTQALELLSGMPTTPSKVNH